jgi:hypothetical protein
MLHVYSNLDHFYTNPQGILQTPSHLRDFLQTPGAFYKTPAKNESSEISVTNYVAGMIQMRHIGVQLNWDRICAEE